MTYKNRILSLLSQYNPKDKGDRADIDCPRCGKHRAYVKYEGGYFSYIKCNRINSCGFSEQIKDVFDIDWGRNKRGKKADLFRDHGLNLNALIKSKVVTEKYKIRLGDYDGNLYEKYLGNCSDSGKIIWKNPRGWSSKLGEFYDPIHSDRKDSVLYVFEGEWDMLKGVQDGLVCTSSFFGCNYLPKNEKAFKIFDDYDRIIICYDKDKAGVEGSKRLGSFLAKKFHSKELFYIDLPEGMDYCDYRKEHSFREFKNLPLNEIISLDKFNINDVKTSVTFNGKKYILADTGVYKEKRNKKGEFQGYSVIYPDILNVEEIVEMIDGEEVSVKLTVVRGQEQVLERIVDLGTIASRNPSKFASLGFLVNSQNSTDVCNYIYGCIRKLKEKKFLTSTNGWIDKEKFVVGDTLIEKSENMIVEDKIYNDFSFGFKQNGELNNWKNKVSDLCKNNAKLQVLLSCSAIAPILSIVECRSFLFHIWDKTTSGKTIAQNISCSFWGEPEQSLKEWKSTGSGIEIFASKLKNLPMFLQDSHMAEDSEIKTIVYYFGNSQGKMRGTWKNSQLGIANNSNWRTSFISSGENKITDTCKKFGINGRIIELKWGDDIYLSEDDENFFNSCYGEPGIEFIRNVMQLSDVYLKRQYKHHLANAMSIIENRIQSMDRSPTSIENRLLHYWGAILLGCELLNSIFGIPFDVEDIFDIIERSIIEIDVVDPVDEIYNAVVEIYESNESKFDKKIPALSDKGYEIIPCKAFEKWGFLDETDNTVCFFGGILRKQLHKNGYSHSLIRLLKERDLIQHEKGKLVKKKPFGKTRPYFYCIKIE